MFHFWPNPSQKGTSPKREVDFFGDLIGDLMGPNE